LRKLRFKRKKSKIPFGLKLLVPIIFLLAILWVWKSTEATNLSRQLTGLERTKNTMTEENKRLMAELAKYRSVAWIDSCVRSDSSMTYDIKNRLILFEKNQSNSRPQSSKGLYAGVLELLENVFKEKK
jgi:hypothetical protein